MTVRNWIGRLFNRSHKVDNVFFVSERDKGDYYNLHVHMLLDTNTDMTYKEVRYGLGNISVGDYQPVYNNEEVCKYVTKYIGKDVDYDIVFKKLKLLSTPTVMTPWVLGNDFSVEVGG